MKNILRLISSQIWPEHSWKIVLFVAAVLCLFQVKAQQLDVEGKAKISEMDTVMDATSNVVRNSDGTLAVRQYKVGDYVQGGIVFWVDETGEHGLVCDTADISTGISWYNGTYKVTNATGDGVGAGAMNTMLIIAQQTVDNPSGDFAALKCANLVREQYGDWYLPSKDELHLMYLKKSEIDAAAQDNGGGVFASAYYWSSTEVDDSFVWGHGFVGGGSQGVSTKEGNVAVRAVRIF